jgi:hypothetical protein
MTVWIDGGPMLIRAAPWALVVLRGRRRAHSCARRRLMLCGACSGYRFESGVAFEPRAPQPFQRP